MTDESSMYQKSMMQPIEHLFLRMASIYGKDWLALWAGIPLEAIHAEWAEELGDTHPAIIKLAVDHCRAHFKYPPRLPEFKQLCKTFTPKQFQHKIERKFSEQEIKQNRMRLRKILQGAAQKMSVK